MDNDNSSEQHRTSSSGTRAEHWTSSSGTRAAPVAQTQRLQSIDVLRGFALLGILAMNVMVFAMPFAAYNNPTVYPEYEGTNRIVYWVTHTIFDLKMMALFSMLFGAGVVIWTRKATTPEDHRRLRWIWLRRMFWLFVIGMIHAWIIWEGDILVAYAVCGAAALWWLRRLPPVWLLIVAGAFFAIHLLLMGFMSSQTWLLFADVEWAEQIRQSMTPEQLATAREEAAMFLAATPEQVAEDIAWLRGSWMELFKRRAEFTFMMQVFILPLYLFWRSTAMMLLGAALMKMGVFSAEKSPRFYAGMAILGYAIGLPMVVGGILYNESHGFDIVYFSLPGQWFNLIGSVPMALGHAGLILWVFKKGYLARLTFALSRVGQMAFTNYLMQSVLCSLIFFGWGLGMAGEFGRLGQQMIVVGIWIVQILWSVAWLSKYRFGPAEWLWRSLTYWKLQPMVRAEVAAEGAGVPLDKVQ